MSVLKSDWSEDAGFYQCACDASVMNSSFTESCEAEDLHHLKPVMNTFIMAIEIILFWVFYGRSLQCQ